MEETGWTLAVTRNKTDYIFRNTTLAPLNDLAISGHFNIFFRILAPFISREMQNSYCAPPTMIFYVNLRVE